MSDWKNRGDGSQIIRYFKNGKRLEAVVKTSGEYYVDDLMVTESHVPSLNAEHMRLIVGTADNLEEGKKEVMKFFGEKKEEPKVEKVELKRFLIVDEDHKDEEPLQGEEKITTDDLMSVLSSTLGEMIGEKNLSPVINVNDNVVEIKYYVPNAKVRYTTNGKDVRSTNKVYTSPFEIDESVEVIKAMAFLENGEKSEQSVFEVAH